MQNHGPPHVPAGPNPFLFPATENADRFMLENPTNKTEKLAVTIPIECKAPVLKIRII
jgi:hypothetical protein